MMTGVIAGRLWLVEHSSEVVNERLMTTALTRDRAADNIEDVL